MIIVTAVVASGAMLLAWAGLDHVRAPDQAAAGLAIPGRLSRGRGRGLAVVLGATEIAVGVAALAVLVAPVRAGGVVLGVQGAVYLGFLGHLFVRYRHDDREDCGCAGIGARIGAAGLLRAGTLGLASIAAAVSHPAVALPTTTPTDPRLALGAAASVVLCLLLYALPPAVDGLARRPGTRRYA